MRKQEAETLIDYIIDQTEYEPSAWEQDFLDSVSEQLETKDSISDKQSETLQKIYAKATDGGVYQQRERI